MVEPLVIPFVVVVRDELADGATQRAQTPLYVKTVVHAAKSAAWRAR